MTPTTQGRSITGFSTTAYYEYGSQPYFGQPFSAVALCSIPSGNAASGSFASFGGSGAGGLGWKVGITGLVPRVTFGNIADYPGATNLPVTTPFVLGFTVDTAAYRLFQDGVFKESVAVGTATASTQAFRIGVASSGSILEQWPGGLHGVLIWNRALSDAEQAIVAQNFWSFFTLPKVMGIQPPINLQGAASSVAALTGALTASIKLAGSAAAVAAATGALSTQIPLSGGVTATTTASASLSTIVALTGAITDTAAVVGELSTGMPLLGSIQDVATASGSLTTAINLAGAIANVAAATGSLTTAVQLAGAAADAVSATGACASHRLPIAVLRKGKNPSETS
jgi:hypothetical protein